MAPLLVDQTELAESVRELCEMWNRAEGRMKRVEQLRGEIIVGSINELRYAGRCLADVLQLLATEPVETQAFRVQHKLHEARSYIERAHADAIDAAVLYVGHRLTRLVESYGLASIVSVFPQYPEVYALLREANEFIALSREERMSKQEIYRRLEESTLPQLIEAMHKLSDVEHLLKPSIERRLTFGLGALSAVAIMGGSIAALFIDSRWPMLVAFLASVGLFLASSFARGVRR